MAECVNQDILFFFDGRPIELALYESLASAVLARYPKTEISCRRTQISFFDGHMFACVSLTPVRRRAERPERFITVSFSLEQPLDDPRALAVRVRPNRFTHHVVIGDIDEIDAALLGWIDASHALAAERKR